MQIVWVFAFILILCIGLMFRMLGYLLAQRRYITLLSRMTRLLGNGAVDYRTFEVLVNDLTEASTQKEFELVEHSLRHMEERTIEHPL